MLLNLWLGEESGARFRPMGQWGTLPGVHVFIPKGEENLESGEDGNISIFERFGVDTSSVEIILEQFHATPH